MEDQTATRLKEARKAAGFRSARSAAESLGVKYSTYAGHENARRGLNDAMAVKYATQFGVSLDWLLMGEGNGPAQPLEDAAHLLRLYASFTQEQKAAFLALAKSIAPTNTR